MIVVIIILAVIVIGAIAVIVIRNGMVGARNRVDEAWSGIDVQLKRRHDLVPNLVETVKGYATHEAKVFQETAEARANAMKAASVQDTSQAEGKLSGSLAELRAVAGATSHRELPTAPARPFGDRRRDPGITPDLQLERPVLQHPHSGLPELHDCRCDRL